MPDNHVDLIITSPPYNIGIEYNEYKDKLHNDHYLNWMGEVVAQFTRILKETGSIFINVGSTCLNPYISMDICSIFRKHLILQNHIIWVKAITAWDSKGNIQSYGHIKPKPRSIRFLNQHYEDIYHFTKTGDIEIDRFAIGVPYQEERNSWRWKHTHKEEKSNCRCRGNVWYIPYKTIEKKKSHPAGFPEELPELCIKVTGTKGLVLDPFLGAGTTLVACDKLDVEGIGIEIDQSYCNIAEERLTALSH